MTHSQSSDTSSPILLESVDEELKCPFCQTVIVPHDVSNAVDFVMGTCKHLVLNHLWGHDPDYQDLRIAEWWKGEETEMQDWATDEEGAEKIYRSCPLLDVLVEYRLSGGGPMSGFVASFGFRAAGPD
jgi:hypothetical protein